MSDSTLVETTGVEQLANCQWRAYYLIPRKTSTVLLTASAGHDPCRLAGVVLDLQSLVRSFSHELTSRFGVVRSRCNQQKHNMQQSSATIPACDSSANKRRAHDVRAAHRPRVAVRWRVGRSPPKRSVRHTAGGLTLRREALFCVKPHRSPGKNP